MGGGDKRHVIPPCQNMGGIHTPHPPGIYALGQPPLILKKFY